MELVLSFAWTYANLNSAYIIILLSLLLVLLSHEGRLRRKVAADRPREKFRHNQSLVSWFPIIVPQLKPLHYLLVRY